jgi:hypothetical protein
MYDTRSHDMAQPTMSMAPVSLVAVSKSKTSPQVIQAAPYTRAARTIRGEANMVQRPSASGY